MPFQILFVNEISSSHQPQIVIMWRLITGPYYQILHLNEIYIFATTQGC